MGKSPGNSLNRPLFTSWSVSKPKPVPVPVPGPVPVPVDCDDMGLTNGLEIDPTLALWGLLRGNGGGGDDLP
ncbi:hypothetical protein PG987_009763 [Apiospora arundinis]